MSEKIEFETFRVIGNWEIGKLKTDKPSCLNSNVNVRKYRITVEEVQESDDVIAARLLELWETSGNHHHWGPLEAAAKKVGVKLDCNTFGRRRK